MSFNKRFQLAMVACVALLLAACAQTYRVDVAAIENAELMNMAQQENKVFSSGQPTQEQLPALAGAGIRHVISLRPASELDWDEAAAVAAAGMQFHSIPVAGAGGVTNANAQTLESLLSELDGQPVLVHCASSNRVGALKAVSARNSGASVEDAIAEGRGWGLTGMEQAVRGILTTN
ncbi:MAG: sulfur transferase domain-containing protein [Gammaproteobacteria bacterium]